jgi:sodium/potassium-transporting ATPase subunit alpha
MKLDFKTRLLDMLPCMKRENKVEETRNQELPDAAVPYHKMSLQEMCTTLNTSLSQGLDEKQAADLLAKNGPNKIKQVKPNLVKKWIGFFLGGFGKLFLIAAIACIICWKPLGSLQASGSDPVNLALGVLLLIVIVIQAGFNAFQDWSSTKVMNSIKNMMPSSAYVYRNGREIQIQVEELVVGDVVKLTYGNKVPADVRIIDSKDLKFDKSMLTGESEAIEGVVECTDEKYVESKNIGFMTTLITNGQGKGIVVATGDQTIMGKIAGFTNQAKTKQTNLQREIHRFINIIVAGALISAAVVIIAWAAWLRIKFPNYINYIALIVNVISVVIGFIPDG